MEILEMLPGSWGQVALWASGWLLFELRHYAPLLRRYFEARVKRVESETEGADEDEK